MEELTDPKYLADQYKTSEKLNTRICLHDRFSTNSQGWFAWVYDRLDHPGDQILPETALLLELGCGSGELWVKNQGRLKPGWRVILSDLSLGMVQKTAIKLNGVKQFSWLNTNAELLPVADASLDGIIANHMLYHVPDLEITLQGIRRVLKMGGRFFASTLGKKNLSELIDLLNGFDNRLGDEFRSGPGKFILENGGGLIRQYFKSVEVFNYPDSLRINEVQPLIDYVLSGRIKLNSVHREDFTKYIQYELNRRNGVFEFTKVAGMFIAS